MNPEDSQNTSSNYLDEIAPKDNSRNNLLNKKSTLIFGILGILTLITLLLVVVVQLSKGSYSTTEQLAARLISIKSTADDSTENLKSSRVRAINSDLKIYLTNTIRDFKPILEKKNIDIEELSPKVLKIESNEKLLEKLEDARLNAVLDRTYAREMSYVLELTANLINKIVKSNKDSEFKIFLESAKTNLIPIQEEFELFSAN